MCTAISYKTTDHYFGRNLDLDYSYEETVTVTPRKYPLHFRKEGILEYHYAIMGMAYVYDNYPLYYDAINEKGLGVAGLNFPGNAIYKSEKEHMSNIAPFEFIPWILAQCKTVRETRELLMRTNIMKACVHSSLPVTPLHFMITDKDETIVVEPTKEGVCVYDNPVRVLTNNPPFPFHMWNLNDYQALTRKSIRNTFARELPLESYSRGMGAMGLPGDLSSTSRFVRAAFVKWNALDGRDEAESVSQFFHILGSVEQQKGCVELENGEYERTIYTSCCNTDKGIYYYKTYDNSTICAVNMHHENLNGKELVSYPLELRQNIIWQN